MREGEAPEEFKTGTTEDCERGIPAEGLCFVGDLRPHYSFVFFNDKHEQVGILKFAESPATFEGNVDESAAAFMKAVCVNFDMFRRQIQLEVRSAAFQELKLKAPKWHAENGDILWDKLEEIIKNPLV